MRRADFPPDVDELIFAAVTHKQRVIEQIINATGPRSVRITFDSTTDLARVDELMGDYQVAPVTERRVWETVDEAEVLAALYAAVRQLPISRVDVP